MRIANLITFTFIFGFFCLFAVQVYAQSTSSVRTRIGNPPTNAGSGWPTKGRVTQGPKGPSGHAAHSLVALDIANAPGTPIHATFDGIAYGYDCTNKGECNLVYGRLGNYVMLIPDNNPSAKVLFGHMMKVDIPSGGANVKAGEKIGLMGFTGYVEPPGPGGTHLHYEFRGLPMSPPNIPEAIIPETCGACNPLDI